MQESEQKLLAMTEEAAVLVRGGRAVYANAAARQILGQDCVGKRAAALFGELVTGVQASSFLAQIRLGSKPYLVRIARLEQEQIFFLRPQDELPAVLNQPFVYALRGALMNLGLASDQIRLQAEDSGSTGILESLRSVTRSQYQILRLLNNASLILDLSREEAMLDRRVFDLSALCRSLLDALKRVEPRLSFTDRCGSGILVRADPQRIKDLLMNLLSNAIRHARGCTRISLSLLEAPGSVILAVDDDGCGIPAEELPQVFDRYRHGYTLSQMGAGPGLGLTVARLIAQQHGGALLLESRPGRGTTLRVSLRREEQELLRAPEEVPTLETRELLTGLADCLPADCFREQYLD